MQYGILKDKNFLLLMFGKITSLVGSSMQNFALSLFVLATTGSATKFASILAVSIIPQLIIGPFAGVFVDWFYRKKLLIFLDFLSGSIATFFTAIYLIKGEMPLRYIYVLVILLSVISTIFQPALQTIIPTIVNKDELVNANSVNSLVMALGSLLAPVLAGICYGAFGLKIIFIINAVTFFISSFSECFLNIPRVNETKEKMNFQLFKKDFTDGLKYTFSNKPVTIIVTLAMILNFTLYAAQIGETFLCKQILKLSDFQYGLTQSMMVASMMIASVITPFLSKKYSLGKNVYLSLLFTGVTVCLCAIVSMDIFINAFASNFIPFIFVMILCFFIGLLLGIANIFIAIYFQSIIPLDYMGRVGTVQNTLCMLAMPLSSILSGFLFDRIPASIIFIFSGILTIIPVLIYKKFLVTIDMNSKVESNLSE